MVPLLHLSPTFIIKGEFISLNEYINAERTNKYIAASIKKREMGEILVQLPNGRYTEKIFLSFQAFVKDRRKDPDNIYVMFVKHFLDSLVKKGIIENDGQKHIGQIILQEPLLGEPRMEVTVF